MIWSRRRASRQPVSRTDPDQAWKAVDWSAHAKYATIRGRRVRYTDIGSGPAAVLIHGQGGAWQWWLRVMPAMAEHARIVAVDLAGFGESDPIATGDVFGEHVATIVGLLDHLGLPEATIVGHSMGGLVSIQVASEHPARVSGLLLVNAGGANIGAQRLRLIVAGFRVFDAVFSISVIPRLIATRQWLRSALFAAAVHDRRSLSTPLAVEIIPRMAAPGFMQSLQAAASAVNHVRPETITCPCVVVWGSRDRILPLATGHSLAARIPGARLVPLEEVGHCPMVEAPDRFTAVLAGFVREHLNGRAQD
jgi:pimeloyl-ACP methyl ester carboxylesterase